MTPRLPRLALRGLAIASLASLVALSPAAADVGPFSGWAFFVGNTTSGGAGHGYLQAPHHGDLNPTSAITIEMWVKLRQPSTSCGSLIGKDYTQAYWVGICGQTVVSYLRGSGSNREGGTIPLDTWVHVAVTSDGVTRRHFINGSQVGSWAAGGPNTTSPDPVRIGSDVSWLYTPPAEVDEVRIWRIALTSDEINAVMQGPILAPQPGLVAAWSLDHITDGTFDDAAGSHDATGHGEGSIVAPPVPAGSWITVPDLSRYRFKVRINGVTTGTQVPGCMPETVCIAGVIPSRTEVLLRVIGPRPNGWMHAQVIKFTVSRVEVWVNDLATGLTRYYELNSVGAESSILPGIVHKEAFVP